LAGAPNWCAIKPHLAGIGRVESGRYVHRRGSTGTILAEKRVNFASVRR
jgi:hypothetical protein